MMGSLRHWDIWSSNQTSWWAAVRTEITESDEVNLSYPVFPDSGDAVRLASGTTGIGVRPHLTECPGLVIKMLRETKPRATSLSPLGLTYVGDATSDGGRHVQRL